MKLSTKATQALQILENWENKNTVFNFEKIFTAGYFHTPRITDCIYLLDVEEDFKNTIKKQFYEIAETGEGGAYALWNYPELQGEPPVIYFETDGDFKMVAPSLEAFACMFSLDKYIEEAYVFFDDICEYYDLESEEEAEELFNDAVEEYKETIASFFEVKELEDYLNEMNNHKNFKEWEAYVEENNKDTKGSIGNNYIPEKSVEKTTNQIDINEFVATLYLPTTDSRIINVFAQINMQPPQYKKENFCMEDYGEELCFIFQDKNYNNELLLTDIIVLKGDNCTYPFDIKAIDTYQDIVSKIGKPATHRQNGGKHFLNTRIWFFENKNKRSKFDTSHHIKIFFNDEALTEMKSFTIGTYNPNEIAIKCSKLQ